MEVGGAYPLDSFKLEDLCLHGTRHIESLTEHRGGASFVQPFISK